MNVVAAKPTVSGDYIRTDLLEGVAQVRVAVRVVNGCGEIESRQSIGRRSGQLLFVVESFMSFSNVRERRQGDR